MKSTVKDLKVLLQQKGLPVSGVKVELVKRLLQYEASLAPKEKESHEEKEEESTEDSQEEADDVDVALALATTNVI